MLCMSPLNPKFPERARRFPGLVSAPTIDWFLPWPEEALVAVSQGLPRQVRDGVRRRHQGQHDDDDGHVPRAHHRCVFGIFREDAEDKCTKLPKSYLSFIAAYQVMYKTKLAEIEHKEASILLGLGEARAGREGRGRHEGLTQRPFP